MKTNTAIAGMSVVQVAACEALEAVLAGRNLDVALDQILSRHSTLTTAERSATRSIAFDTVRHLGSLRAQLETLLERPPKDARIRNLLLVALAQLQYAKTQAHVVVDCAVTATAMIGLPRTKALVNAVLRSYLRDTEKFDPSSFSSPVAKWSFPNWWIKLVKSEHPKHWQEVLGTANCRPPMWLRVNRRKISTEDYLVLLSKTQFDAFRHQDAIGIANPVPVQLLPGFTEGLVSVQDVGAQLAARILLPSAGNRVLDACSAPGGKTAHLLEAYDIDVTALDRDPARLARVTDNLERLGLEALTRVENANNLGSWWDGVPFERILLDVPCSGSGVVRRHPDIKWIRRQADIEVFARTQYELLSTMWNCLSVGGRLLYATCSIFHAENQSVVDRFLRVTPNATQQEINPEAFGTAATLVAASLTRKSVQLLPNNVHDGFFYALLERTG